LNHKEIAVDEPTTSFEATSREVVDAMCDLPILARLEFVRNIVFSRGGTRGNSFEDEGMIIASDVLRDVIKVLQQDKRAAELRHFEP
jgi:hypothetical protein